MNNNLMMLSGDSGGSVWDGTAASPDPALMKSGSTVYNVGGRAVYRHVSDKGSVMHWTDKSGTVHKTLVLDAAYRFSVNNWNGSYRFFLPASSGYTSMPAGLVNYSSNNIYYVSSGTDSAINESSYYFEDINTSKYNTDIYVSYVSDGHSYNFCRNNGSGIVADSPNIQTLLRIYLCSSAIDSLDPTKESIASTSYDTSISNWSIGRVWSSTWHTHVYISTGSYSNWAIFADGKISYIGSNTASTIPTLDL